MRAVTEINLAKSPGREVEAQVGRKGGWTWESRSPQRSQFAPELLLPALIDGKVANTCSGSTLRTAHRSACEPQAESQKAKTFRIASFLSQKLSG